MWAVQPRFERDLRAFMERAAELGYEAVEINHSMDAAQIGAILGHGVLPITNVHAPAPLERHPSLGWNRELDLAAEDEQERALQAQQQAFTCNNIHDRNQRKIDTLQGEVGKLDAQVRAAQSIESYRADGESNLRRYTPPDLQLQKTGPKRSKILLAGLFGGGALGCAVALLRQLLERRVRYRETLEGSLGLTVLAVVDEHKGLRKLRAGRAS